MPVPTHPPTHAPFPPSRYQGTAARATWCSGWAWLGFPKISRACLLLASSISRASPLLLLCPCLCSRPPPRHDTTRTQPSQVRKASSSSATISPPPSLFIPPTSSSTDGGAHHPTVSAKKHSSSPRLDRNPTKTQSQTHHDQRWSDPTLVTRTGARPNQPSSNTRHL